MRQQPLKDKFRGCLLAGALGDAWGYPAEFLSNTGIWERFGAQGVRSLVDGVAKAGSLSDDTQMTLFTVEGLLLANRNKANTQEQYVEHLHRAWLRWLQTQTAGEHGLLGGSEGSLLAEEKMWVRRGPGNTCLRALAATKQLGRAARNCSKGCGALMRIAPLGLYFSHKPALQDGQSWQDSVFAVAAAAARTTHGHPYSSYASGFFAVVIGLLAQGVSLRQAIQQVRPILNVRKAKRVAAAVDAAQRLADDDEPKNAGQLARLGEGWVAEEALAIALYCALGATSLEECLILGTNHAGDSDSTAALAGQLFGLEHGSSCLSETHLTQLELRNIMTQMAAALAECAQHP